jgi:hypothetical protein
LDKDEGADTTQKMPVGYMKHTILCTEFWIFHLRTASGTGMEKSRTFEPPKVAPWPNKQTQWLPPQAAEITMSGVSKHYYPLPVNVSSRNRDSLKPKAQFYRRRMQLTSITDLRDLSIMFASNVVRPNGCVYRFSRECHKCATKTRLDSGKILA